MNHPPTPEGTGTFDTVLIANRGEIAMRVIHSVQQLGLRAVAVYSEADTNAPHVHAADQAVLLGPAAANQSYLDIDKVIAAAHATGAGAIHPGYGFLSENAAFARRCEAEGIVFIGPPASAIDAMGDKITARATVESRNVPTVPGISRPGLTDEDIIAAAPDIGFPVLIKPSAGGGGKGMHRVENPADLPAALTSARREAASSFGDDTLFLEHFVDTPRHIEVQVVADAHGNVIHLGERECSLQRRHQKVIEEAPSALLDDHTRQEIGAAACDAARACGYRGAGTVEFIVSAKQPDRFFFMEMNTRLQVEHPVTEEVTGVDLVEWQIRIAQGEALPLRQDQITLTGHAVEARIYAEDPAAGFLPTGGTLHHVQWPQGKDVRVDAGVSAGQEIGSDYDPMLAKVIAYGPDRATALQRLDRALANTLLDGVTTNVDFNRFVVTHPTVVAGQLDTGLLDRIIDDYQPHHTPTSAYAVALLALQHAAGSAPTIAGAPSPLGSAWTSGDAWRSAGHPAPVRWLLTTIADATAVTATAHQEGTHRWRVEVVELEEPAEGETNPVHTVTVERVPAAGDSAGDGAAVAQVGDAARTGSPAAAGEGQGMRWLVSIDSAPASPWIARVSTSRNSDGIPTPTCHLSHEHGCYTIHQFRGTAADAAAAAGDTAITSPMPGTIISVEAADGATVTAGQAVIVMEAMKMEHTLSAAVDGTVSIKCSVGDKVGTGDVLADIEPEGE